MNIWCISKYASPPQYGPTPRLFHLAREFSKMGHNPFLITSDANHFATYPETDRVYNYEEHEGVPICWIKTAKYSRTASISRLWSWIDFERRLYLFDTTKFPKPDVVIASSLSILTVLYGIYLKKKLGVRLVFEVRDIWPLTMTEEGGFSRWHPLVLLIGWIERVGYRKADLIVGTMPGLGMHVENVLGFKRPVFCSPFGVNSDNPTNPVAKVGNSFDAVFPKGKTIVGYAGSMGITNALEPFIEAIKSLQNRTDIHFMLVGGGDLKQRFETELAHCDNVTFLPKITPSEVQYFLAKCDILYLSTKSSKVWDYGQSMNKVVDYMISGKPILASYTGLPSMIDEAGCGKFIQESSPEAVTHAILELVSLERDELERMGQRGREWIYKHRRYSVLAKGYIDKLAELVY